MNDYYTAIIFMNIFALLLIQLCVAKSNTLTKARKSVFHALFNAIIIAAFCEWFGNFLQGTGSSTRILHIVVKAAELSVAPSIAFLFSWVIEKKREKEIAVYLTVNAILEILSGMSGFIYDVDENSYYTHGEFYFIYVLAYVISIIYCIIIFLKNVKKYQYNGSIYFLLVIGFMLTGIVIQLCNSEVKIDYMTLAIASVMVYVMTLEMIYQTDELTELINRRGYENYIAHLEGKCMILFFDVDHFKEVNDTYGHACGDLVLKKVGKTLKNQYMKYGKCFRYGGDEFCVVLTKDIGQIEQLNRKFEAAWKQVRSMDKRFPDVSTGYAFYDSENQSMQDVVGEADTMMYQCKEAHKKGQQVKRSIREGIK